MGVPDQVIEHIDHWWDLEDLSPRERVACAYADAITYSDQDVDDKLFEELASHFDDDEIVALTAVIAFENFRSKFNRALRIEAQGFSDNNQ